MTSILLQLIFVISIDLPQPADEMASSISTTEESTTARINTSSAGVKSKYIPEWLKWFVRSGNLTTIHLLEDHNLTVLPARSFALWPETQVRKDFSSSGLDWMFHELENIRAF